MLATPVALRGSRLWFFLQKIAPKKMKKYASPADRKKSTPIGKKSKIKKLDKKLKFDLDNDDIYCIMVV